MKRILITGGAGFIGSHFAEYLLRNTDCSCVSLDALVYAGNLRNLSGPVFKSRRFTFVKGDIRDVRLVNSLVKRCDVVVNFAAQSHVDRSYDNPVDFVSTNVLGTATLLEAARKYPVERFIHMSTPEVFGTALTKKITEEHPLKPMSPYAGSKAGADRLCYSYYVAYGIPAVILKPSNNYGPRQFPEKLVPLFITNALENKPLPVYGNGRSIRDWLYVEDCCEAIANVMEANIEKVKGEEILIATGETHDVLYVAKKILHFLGKPHSLITHIKDRPGHVKKFVFDTGKMKRLLKWSRRTSFEEGLEKTVRWYLCNEPWWKPVKRAKSYAAFYKSWYSGLGLTMEKA